MTTIYILLVGENYRFYSLLFSFLDFAAFNAFMFLIGQNVVQFVNCLYKKKCSIYCHHMIEFN
jgi:hypothetical protein